jgi:hypothetical protein
LLATAHAPTQNRLLNSSKLFLFIEFFWKVIQFYGEHRYRRSTNEECFALIWWYFLQHRSHSRKKCRVMQCFVCFFCVVLSETKVPIRHKTALLERNMKVFFLQLSFTNVVSETKVFKWLPRECRRDYLYFLQYRSHSRKKCRVMQCFVCFFL